MIVIVFPFGMTKLLINKNILKYFEIFSEIV